MRRRCGLTALLTVVLAGCVGIVEVAVETPLESKIDVSAFRRVLIAGFVTDLEPSEIDLSSETSRLLQNQLRTNTELQVLEPDRPPLETALDRVFEGLGEEERYSKEDQEQFQLQADRLLQDVEFWRGVGEEYRQPLVVTGKLGFEIQTHAGYQPEELVVRRTDRPNAFIHGSRYLERKGFSLDAEFYFIDTRTGELLHKERFTEEVLYATDRPTEPLSCYFDLMDRLLPNFLGVITPQKIRGTRVLLQ